MQTYNKKISIIVPVYKVEEYLDKCIRSLVKQTYKNLEIILVDDGSPDNCPKMCDKWAKKDSRIKVIHKENGGISSVRNTALDIATGDYIGFVDGDDVVSTKMFEILVGDLESTDADMSVCGWSSFLLGSVPDFTYEEKVKVIDGGNVAVNKLLSGKISYSLWNKLYKKDLFEDVRFPLGRNYEDFFIVHKVMIKTHKIAINSSKLYGYLRNRNGSIINTYSLKNIEDYMEANNFRYEDLKNNKDVRYFLDVATALAIFRLHIMATDIKNKSIFDDERLKKDYNFINKE